MDANELSVNKYLKSFTTLSAEQKEELRDLLMGYMVSEQEKDKRIADLERQYNYAEIELEDLTGLHLWLDSQEVPRYPNPDAEYSALGRVRELVRMIRAT